jgi:ABC-type transporter Mla subunit MlaD
MVDVVSDVVINYKSVGLDKAGQEIKQVSTNLDGLMVASTGTEKATASLENRFKSLERTLNTSEGQAQKFAKVQDSVNKAVAQNPELQGRANEVLANAAQKYGQVEKATVQLADAHKGLNTQGQAAFH